MIVKETPLAGLLVIEPRVFRDDRGFFWETHHARRYAEAGIADPFVQDNASRSTKGTLRGLHYQLKRPQGKLVWVIRGEVFDVAVDIRKNSPTFGKWHGERLSGDEPKQLYIPPGFAHGFCVLSESADFMYKCTNLYAPDDERGILWNDPDIGIEWPLVEPRLSDKDQRFQRLRNVPPVDLFG
ncbi:MAG: dTDP-4-dehydrorhamnose 3,5-epimerase [Nitrospirota bacterium]